MSTTHSGFLERYDELETREGTKNEQRFVAKEVAWDTFKTAEIAPVEMRLSPETRARLDEDELSALSAAADEIASEVFAQAFALSSQRDSSGVSIRMAITEIDMVNVGLNAATSILAVPVDKGGVSVELEILEADTERRLFALTRYETGRLKEVGGFFSKLGHVKTGFRRILEDVLATVRPADETILASGSNSNTE